MDRKKREITITVAGAVGIGKSAVALTILAALRSAGLQCTWKDEAEERGMGTTVADIQSLDPAPVIRLVETYGPSALAVNVVAITEADLLAAMQSPAGEAAIIKAIKGGWIEGNGSGSALPPIDPPQNPATVVHDMVSEAGGEPVAAQFDAAAEALEKPVSDAQAVDEFAQDLRHLIVCDTQFGWSGETTLKLPEIERLVVRGWLAEGEENAEYDLTDAGRALIADRLRGESAPPPLSAAEPIAADEVVLVLDGNPAPLPAGVSELQDRIAAVMEGWRGTTGAIHAINGCALEVAKLVFSERALGPSTQFDATPEQIAAAINAERLEDAEQQIAEARRDADEAAAMHRQLLEMLGAVDHQGAAGRIGQLVGLEALLDVGGVAGEHSGAVQIALERRRQIKDGRYSPDFDMRYVAGELAAAAGCYATAAAADARGVHYQIPRHSWPWDLRFWKPNGARHNLVRAGALIAAELDRLGRIAKGERHGS